MLIPTSAEISQELMYALLLAQRYEDDITVVKEYLALQPHNPLVLADLAKAYFLLKQYENAIAALEEATAIDDKLPSALYNLAELRACDKISDALRCRPPGPLARREQRAYRVVCEERATQSAGLRAAMKNWRKRLILPDVQYGLILPLRLFRTA
jgi:tetratricopeptide (TPR) repeat protein